MRQLIGIVAMGVLVIVLVVFGPRLGPTWLVAPCAGLCFVVALVMVFRDSDDIEPRACERCGYDLRGLAAQGTCPECGRGYLYPRPQMVAGTERLALRRMNANDLDAVHAILTDPEVERVWGKRFSRDDAQAWIEKQAGRYERDGCGYWLCVVRHTGQIIGQAGVMMIEVDGATEAGLGWMLMEAGRGNGYATEAAERCVRWAFESTRATRVVAPIRPENTASIRVAERLGAREGWRTDFHGFEHAIYVIERPDA